MYTLSRSLFIIALTGTSSCGAKGSICPSASFVPARDAPLQPPSPPLHRLVRACALQAQQWGQPLPAACAPHHVGGAGPCHPFATGCAWPFLLAPLPHQSSPRAFRRPRGPAWAPLPCPPPPLGVIGVVASPSCPCRRCAPPVGRCVCPLHVSLRVWPIGFCMSSFWFY